MAKYKIIPSSRTIVQSPISIGHKAEKGVEAIEFDLTAWVETYGSGTLTVIMRRWGDAAPYPITLTIDENNKATWTLSDTDTAKAGMAYAQLSYIVGETVVKKSDIYTFRVMDSLTGEGDPPEAYESWLEHLTHLAAEAMAEVLDIEGIVTDKTLTVDGGIADAKATGDALALKANQATTYTKTEVDQMIEDVEVETDTTLSVSGKPADAKKTGDEISQIKADLSQYINGMVAEYDIAQTGTNKINVLLIKGLNYTFTNKTTKACTVNIYYADGSRTALSDNLAVNQSISVTVSRDDAVAIGGWFDAVGTVEITTGYANLWNPYIKSLYNYTHLCRWEVGSVWGDNGKDTDTVTRGIRTLNDTKIYVDSDCVARTINSSIETLYGFKYNLVGTYIERIGEAGKTAIEIVGGYLYRFVLLAPTGTVITDTDIPQYSDNFGVYAKTLNEIMEKTEPEPTPRYIEGVSIGTDLIKRPIKAERVGTGTLYHTQAFLIYNGKYYSTNGTAISVQSKSFAVERDANISVGHGNAFSRGTGNKGYISGWDDNKVYVVNLDDLTIDSVIDLPTTGYTTCAVDDVNGLLYIFQRDTIPNTESFYNLIVYDYVNETTKATYQTSIKFGAMQSCVLFRDKIIVLNGLGTSDIPNGYRVFDKTGNILAEYQFENLLTVEPEGVFVDSETLQMYISYGDGKVYNITFN